MINRRCYYHGHHGYIKKAVLVQPFLCSGTPSRLYGGKPLPQFFRVDSKILSRLYGGKRCQEGRTTTTMILSRLYGGKHKMSDIIELFSILSRLYGGKQSATV